MAETYDSLVEDARRRLNESLAEAAADAVVIAERFDRPLRGVVTDITVDWPEAHGAVYERAKRQKARSTADSGGSADSQKRQAGYTAKSAIARHPDIASDLVSDPEVRNTLRKALSDHDRQQATAAAERDARDPVSSKIQGHRAVQELQSALARHADTVTELMTAVGELKTNDAPWLESALERSEAANASVRYYVEHGETEIDAGLRELAREA